MFKQNKVRIIISSVVILLPILFGLIMWNRLPATMITHWGADGNADGLSGKAFTVFGLPTILLAIHLICLIFTSWDNKQKEQNKKALGIIYWIIPILSLFTSGITYSIALGRNPSSELFTPVLFGILFLVVGNYMPKTKQNRTLGIKLPWTLSNEENWNKTHRLGGKLWVICGLVMIFSVFLPEMIMASVMVLIVLVAVIVPSVYSYVLYRKHKKAGVVYLRAPKTKAEKVAVRISAVIIPLLFIGVAVLMFTGDIDINYEDTHFTIDATYWSDVSVDYAQIDSVEYREGIRVGLRTHGFGSARLSMGTFKNDEFGTYTLFAYTGSDSHVIIESDGKILAISGKTDSDTKVIYETLASKIGRKSPHIV